MDTVTNTAALKLVIKKLKRRRIKRKNTINGAKNSLKIQSQLINERCKVELSAQPKQLPKIFTFAQID